MAGQEPIDPLAVMHALVSAWNQGQARAATSAQRQEDVKTGSTGAEPALLRVEATLLRIEALLTRLADGTTAEAEARAARREAKRTRRKRRPKHDG